VSANLVVPASEDFDDLPLSHLQYSTGTIPDLDERSTPVAVDSSNELVSSWSLSRGKRLFDLCCVAATLPLVLPVMLVVGLATRLTSSGPVLFLQQRAGRDGRTFTILKFRTMEHAVAGAHKPITTTGNQRFTPIGLFLRRWKLDELPQLLNVLKGEMSLVGPRPKLPKHQIGHLLCRPGITGAATITFAREEEVLACLPDHRLDSYYHEVILPAKFRIDEEYTARATFRSDLRLILDTVLRRWDSGPMHRLLATEKVGPRQMPRTPMHRPALKVASSTRSRAANESFAVTSD
jgi:lipopolysaccharide/colanic/teichoic acid biosynthesis glycosyltransferase